MAEKVCRQCRRIVISDKCPVCGGENFTTTWTGVAEIINVEESLIAKEMGIEVPGKYALRVR